ncbi:ergothioneine biosynthesis protein EgtB [soil metagenome]
MRGPEKVETAPANVPPLDRLRSQYRTIRGASLDLCEPLESEDFVLQSMPDASPVKWHLAHSTWFFETFVLQAHLDGYRPYREEFSYLFNSYYNAIGDRLPRPRRGLLSRPSVAEVYGYRGHVDEAIDRLISTWDEPRFDRIGPLIVLGLNHEQQHQELILTDLKHALSHNPIRPVYRDRPADLPDEAPALRWISYPEGVRWIGSGGEGFAFDNETPRHRQFVESFRFGSRPVTCGEFLEFVQDGGYERPNHWLSDGWAVAQARDWQAPLYWEPGDDGWQSFTLAGMRPVQAAEPVCHISYYEANAYARWAGARLPTEAEWETAADVALTGNFAESGRYHPAQAIEPKVEPEPLQVFGDVWEWTASAYLPYAGFRPDPGAIGEYNGKFMCNQQVLRGGSCVTPGAHLRPSYRNFFYPDARWQFSGLRLARDA